MHDLIKYITQELVRYMAISREERQRLKKQRKAERGAWHYRWFGLLPASLAMYARAVKHGFLWLKDGLPNKINRH